MDRARRAEPYSSATIWTREIARNMAGHLSRVSKAHSCVDTRSPKSIHLPKFQHAYTQKRCPTSPMKTRQPLVTIVRNVAEDQELDFRGLDGSSPREESENTPQSILKLEANVYKNLNGKKSFKSEATKSILKSDGMSADDNQEDSDLPATIPTKMSTKSHHLANGEVTTYDSPLIVPQHRHHLAHDYNKRQGQLKIWQENQALIKRLQSTKATLNSKEWERDGKWTQEYLKNQERRRSAIQQGIHRAQASPHAVLRTKPLKALHPHHLKNIHHESLSEKNLRSPAKIDTAGTLSARELTRRGSKGQVAPQQATAANHRRIVELRKQKPLPASSDKTALLSSTSVAVDVKDMAKSDNADKFIPNNEIVNVRFTFSRGNSRESDKITSGNQHLEKVEALELDDIERDVMSLSGAFSPGAELESALNSAAVDAEGLDDDRVPESAVSTDTGDATATTHTLGVNEGESSALMASQQSSYLYEDFHSDRNSDKPEKEVSIKQVELVKSSVESEIIKPETTEQQDGNPNTEEGDEAYDGDDFDPCPSARYTEDTALENEDKIESSGYGSEFEDDTFIDNKQFTPRATTNQEHDEEGEVSYSHDGFVD